MSCQSRIQKCHHGNTMMSHYKDDKQMYIQTHTHSHIHKYTYVIHLWTNYMCSLASQTAFSSFILGQEEKDLVYSPVKNCVTSYPVCGLASETTTCAYTYMTTHIHACSYTHMTTQTRMYTQTHTDTHRHTHTQTQTHRHTHTQ